MSAILLEQAKQQLQAWLDANIAVSQGQAYSMGTSNGNRSLTRANSSEILKQIDYWENKIRELESQAKGKSRNRIYHGVPRDF